MAKNKKSAAKSKSRKNKVKAPKKKVAVAKKASKSISVKKLKKKLSPKPVKGARLQMTRQPAVSEKTPKKVSGRNLQDFFVPLDDRLLVKVLPSETVTPGGLIIPDAYQEQQFRGVVMSVGRGHRSARGVLVPTQVKAGDCVLFNKYSGQSIKVREEDLLILREPELLGVVED